MLMECPKCGFSQPKDRFCANCGVDMEAYKPVPPKLSNQLLNNPTIYLVLIFFLIAGSIYLISKEKKNELITRMEYLKGNPIIIESEEAEESAQVASSAPAETSPVAIHNTAALAPDEISAPTFSEDLMTNIHYLEMPISAFNQLVTSESIQLQDFGDFSVGPIKNVSLFLNNKNVTSAGKERKVYNLRNRGTETFLVQLQSKVFRSATTALTISNFSNETPKVDGTLEVMLTTIGNEETPSEILRPPGPSFSIDRDSGWAIATTHTGSQSVLINLLTIEDNK